MAKMLNRIIFAILFALCAILIPVTYFAISSDSDNVTIPSVFGTVIGQSGKSRGGRTFYKFNSVPYAKPPLGQLRFEPPEPFGKWEGQIDTRKKPSPCPQVDFLRQEIIGNEDCLYLSIFSPQLNSSSPLLPVMVFIYGGHFMFGSNELYNPDYFMDENIVLVTFNYRTNILGFLNTEDGISTGNQGLKDQVLVLKWVQEGIKEFGGDPGRVTIFGNSAGGASVSYHLVSEMSRDLFHLAISQSGTSLCPWAFTERPLVHAQRFASKVGCPSKSSSEMVACLKKKDVDDLMQVHLEILDVLHDKEGLFTPSLEYLGENADMSNVFLGELPLTLMTEGRMSKVPYILGVNGDGTRDEDCFRTAALFDDDKMKELNQHWSKSISNLDFLSTQNTEKVREEYFPLSYYLNMQITPASDYVNLSNIIADRWFLSCTNEAAKLHGRHAPVYLYYFMEKPLIGYGYILEETRSSLLDLPVDVRLALAYVKFLLYHYVFGWPVDNYGVCHTDELQQIFKLSPELEIPFEGNGFEFSREMVKVWASFATNGKPDPFNKVSWPPYQNQNQERESDNLLYMRLSGSSQSMIEEPFKERMKFWKTLDDH